VSRRRALAGLAGFVAGASLTGRRLSAQADPRPFFEHRRTPGLDEMLTPFDFEPVLFANVPLQVYDYTAHGDGSEFTLRRNRQAFDWVDLVPGRPIASESVNLATEVLGTPMAYPILVAPTAVQVPLHPDGEAGMYGAATASSNTPMVLSYNSSLGVDRVAAAATGSLWCQFYPQQDREAGKRALDAFQTAGCRALVVTVDQQASYYERSQHNRHLGRNPRPAFRGSGGPPPTSGPALYRVNPVRLWYTWDYLDEVRRLVSVPILVKGILTADDARLCVERGMDGIIVSNHGGRSMDYGPSTLEVLPEIVAAVDGRIPLIVDSGFRRGEDILKALALGARAVMIGRPARWALGAFGPAGVQRLLEMLQRELVGAAAAAGCASVAGIGPAIVTTRLP
jgi:isopentenyl diphosphate isomerase/L-lactate dehydrogenase-like FMN-dependent dehydrogenase